MVFLSVPVPQMDGSKFASANCGPAVCSELISLCSVDALEIGAVKIRNASGDTSGGIEGGLLARTMNQLTNYLYPFVYASFDDWAFVRELMERRSVGIIIDAGVTVKTKYRTNSFTGNHWLTVAGGSIRNGTVKYEDPGTTYAGWQRIPLQLLREASDFGGRHWILQTPPTEDVDKEAVRRVAVRKDSTKDSQVLGRLEKGETIHVRKTTKGGPWRRDDGTEGHGWHVVTYKGGKAYVKGESLR
jgi:hypothetical protein